MPVTWRVYLVSALLSCVVAAGTALVTVRLFVLPTAQSSPNTMILEGVADMPWGAELEVFYKTPFGTPPNLTFPEGLDQTQSHVTDQKAGSFKLLRDKAGMVGPNVAKVKWKAEGQPTK
jgi:hypothetical protein